MPSVASTQNQTLGKNHFYLITSTFVTASLTVEIKTILDDPFIKLLVGRVNNLNDKHVKDVLMDGKGDEVPESEDNVIENYKGA